MEPSSDDAIERAREQLEAGADHLRRISGSEFEAEFSGLLNRLDVFDEDVDGLRLEFALDADYGIEMYRLVHLRVIEGGGYCDMQVRLHDEEDAEEPDWGRETLSIQTLVDTAPSPNEARPAFYTALRQASRVDRPDLLLETSGVLVHLEVRDGEFSIQFTTD